MPPKQPWPAQTALRDWINQHGLRHTWVARQLGYTPQYLSRVLSGRSPLTDTFRQRCRDRLSVPEKVYNDAPTS